MRSQRLLSILMQLQVHRRMTAGELAKKLEVSERTILRDMDALGSSGVPVMSERGAGGGWSLMEEYQTKLTGLSAEEVRSLFVTHAPKLFADLGLQRASDLAWTKLQAALPSSIRASAEQMRQRVLIDTRGWKSAAESVSSLPALLDAVWRQRLVRFIYDGSFRGAAERTVHPLGLVARGSVWYLVAQRDEELRTYRVSRVREVSVLDEPCLQPADFELAAYWERSASEFRAQLPKYYATFLAKPGVMRWVRYRGWRLESEEAAGDRISIRLRFDVEEEAVQFALSFADDLEVREPVELRGLVRDGAARIVAMYENQAKPVE